MKDPLQTGKTAYEILGVDQNAAKKDIDQAFKKCFASGININEATSARNTLNKSVERGLTDLFQYNSFFTEKLDSINISNPVSLTSERLITAEKLLTLQGSEFPCSACDHSISVFWYWWAVYNEECKLSRSTFGFDIPSPRFTVGQIWLGIIANWGHLIMSNEFWKDWFESSSVIQTYLAAPEELNALKQKLQNHFFTLFSSYTEKFRLNGNNDAANKFREYESLFKKELSIAANFIQLGFEIKDRNKQFPINFGKQLMDTLHYSDLLNDSLKNSTITDPEKIKIKNELISDLSPYSYIRQMLDRNENDKVINTIGQYGEAINNTPELEEILARAYMAKGNISFDSGKYNESLENWTKANLKRILGNDLNETVNTHCKRKIHSLFAEDPTGADSFMENLLKIIDSAELKLIYSDILFQKSIPEIIALQKKVETGADKISKDEIIKLEKNIAKLEKAANYGSINAKNNLTNAKNFLGELKSGLVGLPSDIVELLNQANQESNTGNWDKAISIVQKAVKKTTKENQLTGIKKILAQTYNAKAVSGINQFMSVINPMMEFHNTHLSDMIDAFMCGKDPMSVFFQGNAKEKKKKSSGAATIAYILIGLALIPLILSWTGVIELGTAFSTALYIIIVLLPQLTQFLASSFSVPKLNLYNPYVSNYSRPYCKLCSSYSDYAYELPGYGTVNLCSTHSNSLKKIYEWTPSVEPQHMQLIIEAEGALTNADNLLPVGDELSNTIRENKKAIKDIRERFKF